VLSIRTPGDPGSGLGPVQNQSGRWPFSGEVKSSSSDLHVCQYQTKTWAICLDVGQNITSP
jgi:hypothetical protein